jgi:pimeloyl-ACP methyl ester carboxylesterase
MSDEDIARDAVVGTSLWVLPGLDGTTRLLTDFLDTARAAGFAQAQAVAYPPDRPLDYDALEALARTALPRSEPFVLLGESFSGPIALSIAADPPPNLRALVLSTTFARAPVPWLGPCAPWLAPLTAIAPVRALPTSALSFALLGRWRTPALERALRTALRTVAPAALRARARATLRVDRSESLARIAVPTLVLHANHDRLLRATASRQLHDGIADATLVRIDGPHLLLQTRGAVCAERIARFVRQVVAGIGAGDRSDISVSDG